MALILEAPGGLGSRAVAPSPIAKTDHLIICCFDLKAIFKTKLLLRWTFLSDSVRHSHAFFHDPALM